MRAEEDLARLSERERRVLRLLAAGHTVKSAAAATGDTDNAVTELLRSARRKLAAGSSREVARLLVASEGIQEIGDVFPVLSPAPDPRHDRGSVKPATGAIMAVATIILVLAAATIAADKDSAPPSPGGAPRVTRSSPAQGAVLGPGPFTLSVTFDQAMQAQGYSFATGPEARFPDCERRVRVSSDRRTFSMRCRALAGRSYVVWANHGRFMNFRATSGTPAAPTRIAFSVRGR